MNYSKKDIVMGFLIIAIIIGGFFIYKKYRNPKVQSTTSPVSVEYKNNFENNFKYDIPDNANTFELKDISGGNASGLATDNEVLVDADKLDNKSFYVAWLENDIAAVSLGKLVENKGGWILKYDKSKLNDAKRIIISLETNLDQTIEKKILEGSFK